MVHENVREKLLPVLEERLKEKHVEMRADEKAREYMPEAEEATEEDWGKEYLDYIVSIKTVSSIDEAIAHINCYNTKHSEAIITNDYTHAQKIPGRNRRSGGLRQRLHPLHRRLRIRLRCRNRNQHPKTPRQRPDGTAGADVD